MPENKEKNLLKSHDNYLVDHENKDSFQSNVICKAKHELMKQFLIGSAGAETYITIKQLKEDRSYKELIAEEFAGAYKNKENEFISSNLGHEWLDHYKLKHKSKKSEQLSFKSVQEFKNDETRKNSFVFSKGEQIHKQKTLLMSRDIYLTDHEKQNAFGNRDVFRTNYKTKNLMEIGYIRKAGYINTENC